jgi:hypothetical protein
MGQLKSPPISAREMTNWFLDRFDNPERPLASVALVISDPNSKKLEHSAAPAAPRELPLGTADEVESAIQHWVARASSNKENLTIFYFCGHGVSTSESVLLLRDFGAKPEKRFDGALNLNDFLGGMQTKLPEHQLFLIDACRVPTSLARSVLGKPHLGRSGVDPDDLELRGGAAARQSVHHSSSALEPSYGRIAGASLYTEALIRALDGGGAQSNLGMWVGTPGLQTALAAYTPRLAAKEQVDQVPELLRSVQFKIHKPKKILVPLYITSAPREALSLARIEAKLGSAISGLFDPQVDPPCEEWVMLLPVREHMVAANFRPPATYHDEPPVPVMIIPPETEFLFQFRGKT